MSDAEQTQLTRNGISCYLVRKDQHSPDTVRNVLRREGIGRVWLAFVEVEVRGVPWLAFSMTTLRDEGNDGGWPMMVPRVAEVLSEGTATALELIVAPDGLELFFSVFREGERQSRGRVLPESDDPATSLLDGEELAEQEALRSLTAQLAGPGCEAFFARRQFAVPEWTDRSVDLFRFSERHGKGIEQEDGGKGGGRACFVALDLEQLKQQVRGAKSGELIKWATAPACSARCKATCTRWWTACAACRWGRRRSVSRSCSTCWSCWPWCTPGPARPATVWPTWTRSSSRC